MQNLQKAPKSYYFVFTILNQMEVPIITIGNSKGN